MAIMVGLPIREAWAPIYWDADLTATLTDGRESKGIELSWQTGNFPVTCDPNRLMIRYNKAVRSTATAPAQNAPGAGTFLTYRDITDGSYSHKIVHAATSYAYTSYACTSETGCSSICANVQDVSDEVSTQFERWLATGVRDYDEDTGARVLSPAEWSVGDPELYRFRTGSHDGKLALYFAGGTAAGGGGKKIMVAHTTGTTWNDDWNDPDLWGDPVRLLQVTSAVRFYFQDEDTADTAHDKLDTGDTDDALDPGCVCDPAVTIWRAGSFHK